MKKSVIIAIATLIAAGCGEDPDIAAARKKHAEVVGTEPKAVAVVGTYVLSDQTVVPGGASAVIGRPCEIEVNSDGTFSVTNYPEISDSGDSFNSFFSATGIWQIGTIGTSYGYGYNPKDIWGFRFDLLEKRSKRVESAGFTGPEQPCGLLMIYGDPDSDITLRFKRKGHLTTPSAVPSPAPGAGEVR